MEKFSLKFHCVMALLLRIILVIYSNIHDKIFSVPYTDIDYKVFTDAARHMVNGSSPYNRHTYRYSPLLALFLTPNIYLSINYGKIVFSITDILVGILIQKVLARNLNYDKDIRIKCACLWLYNPLTIIISTRGNADCLAAFLVMLSVYLLQSRLCIMAGLIHGISIHFRLYPLVLSLPMFLSLRTSYTSINSNQIKFTLTCLISLILLTLSNYYFYDYKSIYESFIYHLVRKDSRHNFSVFFYSFYLFGDNVPQFFRILNVLPQILLLTVSSIFYSSGRNLPFALMMQVFIFVVYNTVVTSQYFFWFLSLFPLCSPRLKYSTFKMLALFGIWIGSQGFWLTAAYTLEFQSLNAFNYIWLSSLLFFIVNITILVDLVYIYKKNLLVD